MGKKSATIPVSPQSNVVEVSSVSRVIEPPRMDPPPPYDAPHLSSSSSTLSSQRHTGVSQSRIQNMPDDGGCCNVNSRSGCW